MKHFDKQLAELLELSFFTTYLTTDLDQISKVMFKVEKHPNIALPYGNYCDNDYMEYSPTQYWNQTGQLLDEYGLSVDKEINGTYSAYIRENLFNEDDSECFCNAENAKIAIVMCVIKILQNKLK